MQLRGAEGRGHHTVRLSSPELRRRRPRRGGRPESDGNLLELGGAYNAGPLAVDRWRTTKAGGKAGGNDPLLFVESIPVAETRSYVKRLLLYHWLYRRRFGQDAQSLQETASGQWPIYRPSQAIPATASANSYGMKLNAQ